MRIAHGKTTLKSVEKTLAIGLIKINNKNKKKEGNMPKQIIVSNKSRAQKVKVTFC